VAYLSHRLKIGGFKMIDVFQARKKDMVNRQSYTIWKIVVKNGQNTEGVLLTRIQSKTTKFQLFKIVKNYEIEYLKNIFTCSLCAALYQLQ
jgi:hypothetical protein